MICPVGGTTELGILHVLKNCHNSGYLRCKPPCINKDTALSPMFFYVMLGFVMKTKKHEINQSVQLFGSVMPLNSPEVCTSKCIWDVVFDFNVDEHSWQNQRLVFLIPQADVTITCRVTDATVIWFMWTDKYLMQCTKPRQ